ncbi:MAG: YceD family protein [Albimonas sp.]|uniref:YceD family protein n=1 Tax=Albimonas sp. TaxID=1872425 RepID=UPI0040570E22
MRPPASPPVSQPAPGAGPAPEFSRPVRVSELGSEGTTLTQKADSTERAALARRFGVAAVGRMSFEAKIRPAGDGWRVEGTARARVTQPCVVTLEEIAQEIEEPFSRLYLPGVEPAGIGDIAPDEDEDPPEPLGTRLDPAEIATEAVALAIDPYPRAPGAEFAGVGQDAAEDEAGEKKKPFSALAALRERMERGEES